MKNSKYVSSWSVTLTPDGIYQLTFNTTKKWLNYHRYNDTTYIFGHNENDFADEEAAFADWNDCQQEIPSFLPEIKDGLYLNSSSQNKEQITFFFIPYYHKWIKEGLDKKIMHSNEIIDNI